jgi:hypothetical protein
MDEFAITVPPAMLDLIADRVVARLATREPAVESWVGVDAAAAHLCCRRQRIYDLVAQRRIVKTKTAGIYKRGNRYRYTYRVRGVQRWGSAGTCASLLFAPVEHGGGGARGRRVTEARVVVLAAPVVAIGGRTSRAAVAGTPDATRRSASVTTATSSMGPAMPAGDL